MLIKFFELNWIEYFYLQIHIFNNRLEPDSHRLLRHKQVVSGTGYLRETSGFNKLFKFYLPVSWPRVLLLAKLLQYPWESKHVFFLIFWNPVDKNMLLFTTDQQNIIWKKSWFCVQHADLVRFTTPINCILNRYMLHATCLRS